MSITPLMPVYPRCGVRPVRGEHCHLISEDGTRYLDFASGIAVNLLGHSNEHLIGAIQRQAATLMHVSNLYGSPQGEAVAQRLVDLTFADTVFFTNSGAEAVECAIKTARAYHQHAGNTERFELITFNNAFHGRTMATISASDQDKMHKGFLPLLPGFKYAPFDDLAAAEALIGPHTAGFLVEPIQGEGGVIPATREFMQALRALTKKHNLLMIVDEVQSGCGRAGTLFAYELSDVEPDIMTLGKGIGGGVPLAALLSTKEVACFEPGDQGGTYNGNPLMTAAGFSVISQLTAPGFLEGVRERGEYLKAQLLQLSEERGFNGERGEGLLRALLLNNDNGPKIVEMARDMGPDGLLLNAARPNLLRFMPALNVTKDEIDQMMSMLRSVLDAL